MARFIDLEQLTDAVAKIACDVCIVGAGAAGLYLAHRLMTAGLEVVVLEAGGRTCESGSSVGIESTFAGTPYRGATEGRAFGWGGSTSRWGGLLIPHTDMDLRADGDGAAQTWRHVVDVVKQRASAVFNALKLGCETDFESRPDAILPGFASAALRTTRLSTLAAEFLPFQRRNLTYLLDGGTSRHVTVYLNAVASGWEVAPGPAGPGVVSEVCATSRSGTRLRVAARRFVIAAGAIESARILLEIDRASNERMIAASGDIGRYLSDHLSCSIADVVEIDRTLAAKLLGPVFVRGRMRALRYIAEDDTRRTPKHFAHFIFDLDNAGFRLAKDVLFDVQSRKLSMATIPRVPRALGDLVALGYHRFVHSRLHISSGTPAHLQLDVEQAPNRKNRVYLGTSLDGQGRPIVVIDWCIRKQDEDNLQMLRAEILTRWSMLSPKFPRLAMGAGLAAELKPYDAYHPVGTCRIGSVLNLDLKVNGTANLYVLSTGALPSAGSANPTFSMLCLGDRLAEEIGRECHRRC